MNTNNIQQKHIYNERVQEFFPLFDEIKKEDDLIYNVRVDFNIVKFLTEHADWNWDEDENKNKACGVILQECNKTARQELEDKAKEELNKYITSANNINDDVEDKKVSIYGNHASITLEDNKKEFKISEFLNSDFCQKNGISGFSTLHSDGKSGMHGFVAEEGEKRIRHYVVTDGSYEMTLNWHDKNGKKCTIKIKINKDGVDLTERNGVTEEQLKANTDVKIGGLFLYQIQFREKGQEQEQSFEILERNLYNNRTPPVYNSQSENNLHNNRTPPPPPLRTSSLKKDVSDEQKPENPRLDRSEQTPNNQQQKRTSPPPPLRISSLPSEKDIFNEQERNTSAKSVSQDGGQEDKRYDNPTFATFGHAVPGSRKSDGSEQENLIPGQGKTQQQEERSRKALLQDIRNFEENNLRHIDIDDRAEKNRENNPWEKLKDELPYLPFSDMHEHNSDNQGASDAEWEESEQLFSVTPKNKSGSAPTRDKSHEQSKKSLENIEQKEIGQEAGLLKDNAAETKINDSGYSSPTYTSHYNFQVNPEQLEKRLETIESKKEDASELLEKLNKGFREPSQQATKDLFSESMLEEIKEGKQYDPIRKLLERKVAEQENDNTNLTVDKNSELYKLLEKDAAQLKAGVIEEEKEDTLTECIGSPDRNRVALANKNRKLLWTKRIAEQQEKDDGISI